MTTVSAEASASAPAARDHFVERVSVAVLRGAEEHRGDRRVEADDGR